MRRTPILLALATAALVAACSSSGGPGWTYAPPTEPPASQPAASGEPSAGPSSIPSGAPSAAPSAGASEAPAADVVQLAASGVQWEQTELSAPADTPFTIHFNNKDAGMPHDIVIKDASGAEKFKSDVLTGAAEADYQVPALAAGTYQFVCSIHPNMVGNLTVGG